MNKKTLTIILVIVGAIVGSLAYLLTSTEPERAMQDMTAQTQTTPTSTETAATETTPGRYVAYNPNAIAEADGTKLLFFHAPWCPQCRDLESDIKAQGVPDGVTIIKVDYDSNQALRKQYGVTIQTTVVKVNDDGSLAEKYVAYDEPTLAAVVENLL